MSPSVLGPQPVGGSRLCYPPRYRFGPRDEVGPVKLESRPRLPSVLTPVSGACCCAPSVYVLGELHSAFFATALGTVMSRLNPKIWRNHHERSRNGDAF